MSYQPGERPSHMPWNLVARFATLLVSSILSGSIASQLPIEWIRHHLYFPYLVALPFCWLVRELWLRLKTDWMELAAKKVDEYVRVVFVGAILRYRKRYFASIRRQCGNFDVKGLNTQGTFALPLDNVFVDLLLSPESSMQPIPLLDSNEPGQGDDIWSYMRRENGSGKASLLIIGRPGSGKTTLLRHIALVLAQREKRIAYRAPRRIPIILAFRDLAAEIGQNPDVRCVDLIQRSRSLCLVADSIPPSWFERQLRKGRCVLLLDGLDEIGDPGLRTRIERWLEREMQALAQNLVVVTSRPRASLKRLSGIDRLQIQPFSWDQIEQFVVNWYMANALACLHPDLETREKAIQDANELLRRISSSQVLKELAVNPLLLTMIATIHHYRGKLPERRVELYREIWEVFLSRRDDNPLHSWLSAEQKQCVLEPLAYAMMLGRTQEMKVEEAQAIIQESLERVDAGTKPEIFLERIEESSGLFFRKENGQYGFAHKTFQEYLAAVYSCKRSEDLSGRVGDDWWHGTVRLNFAQSDGSAVAQACLEKIKDETATPGILELANACLKEALQLSPCIRRELESALGNSVLSQDPVNFVPRLRQPIPKTIVKDKRFWLRISVSATVVLLAATVWAILKPLAAYPPVPPHNTPTSPIWPVHSINVVFLLSGDMTTMAEIHTACQNSLAKNPYVRDISYSRTGGLGHGEDSEIEWKNALDGIEGKLRTFPKDDFNYIIAIGTQASMRAKKYFAPMLKEHNYRLIGVGLTDPIAAGLITTPLHRNDPLPIGVVAFLQRPENFAREIQKLLPHRILHYVYETGVPQNDQLASGLKSMVDTGEVVLNPVEHPLTDADFPKDNPGHVFFSWYPFEQTPGFNNVLKTRIFVATRQQDVEDRNKDEEAALGVSPDLADLGKQGADLLVRDFRNEVPLGKADMGYPARLKHWINCRNTARLHLTFPQEALSTADGRFECDQ